MHLYNYILSTLCMIYECIFHGWTACMYVHALYSLCWWASSFVMMQTRIHIVKAYVHSCNMYVCLNCYTWNFVIHAYTNNISYLVTLLCYVNVIIACGYAVVPTHIYINDFLCMHDKSCVLYIIHIPAWPHFYITCF